MSDKETLYFELPLSPDLSDEMKKHGQNRLTDMVMYALGDKLREIDHPLCVGPLEFSEDIPEIPEKAAGLFGRYSVSLPITHTKYHIEHLPTRVYIKEQFIAPNMGFWKRLRFLFSWK